MENFKIKIHNGDYINYPELFEPTSQKPEPEPLGENYFDKTLRF